MPLGPNSHRQLPFNTIPYILQFIEITCSYQTLTSVYAHLIMYYGPKTFSLFQKWRHFLPTLSEEALEDAITQYIKLIISAKDKFVQLKVLHRIYYTSLATLHQCNTLLTL